MARYTGPVTRKSRRLGVDLVGGDQSFEKRPYPPGQHGRARIKESEYRQQLQEKQKATLLLRRMENSSAATTKRQPAFRQDRRQPVADPGEPAGQRLYRAGLAGTRRMARQLVSHGHFTVNGVKVDIPSYRVSQYDIIDIKRSR